MREMINNMNALTASNNYMAESLNKINNTLSNISSQVVELQNKDLEKSKQIREMDNKIRRLEQKALEKNIEITNANAVVMGAEAVVKKVAASVGVDVTDAHIDNAYSIKTKNKIIVEFSSLNKKKEIMRKMKRHRVDENVLDDENNNPTNRFIYINDELTADNRRILWMAKTKAKENGWRYVWVKDGRIYAKRNENCAQIIINNQSDIEKINADQ